MNERQKQLINILAGEEEYVVGKKLAKLLNVSDRTIRSDVDKINSEIPGLVKSSRRDGYCINNDVLFSNRGRYSSNIPQTPEERVHWMIMEMMVHNQPLSLKRLEDEIFISSYSIDRDCEKIKEILRDYGGLRLIRSSNHIRIEGNEEEKRDLYKNLLSQEIHGNFLNLNALAKFFKNVDLLLISDVFQEVCKEYDYTVRETNYPMIMLHAGVAFSRIKGKHYIDEEEVYEKTKEYEISKEFFTRVCNKINAIYDEGEVYKFSHILLGRNIGMLNTNDEHKLVMMILQGIKERFDIDFTADDDLIDALSTHMYYLQKRLKNDVQLENYILNDIKREYPLVFEIAVYACEIIHNEYNYSVSETEISYLAIHFGAAYERMTNGENKYRTIIILPHSAPIVNICIDKISERFGQRIEYLKIMKIFDTRIVERLRADLIITTVPLNHDLDIPTVKISLFLNDTDESKIMMALRALDKKRNEKAYNDMIKRLVRKDLCHFKIDAENKEDLIIKMCDELIEKRVATKEYKEDVLKRETMSSTSFINGFAVPHSMTIPTKRSCISFVTLNDPLKWGSYEVKLVLLLGIKAEDQNLLRLFFEWLTTVTGDAKKFQELLHIESYEELMMLIK